MRPAATLLPLARTAANRAWLEIGAAWPHRDGKGYGVMLNFIPRSPDAELVIRAIEPKPLPHRPTLRLRPRRAVRD
jgi:hypothetical protein